MQSISCVPCPSVICFVYTSYVRHFSFFKKNLISICIQAGGSISSNGRLLGRLEVSRAFDDRNFKKVSPYSSIFSAIILYFPLFCITCQFFIHSILNFICPNCSLVWFCICFLFLFWLFWGIFFPFFFEE